MPFLPSTKGGETVSKEEVIKGPFGGNLPVSYEISLKELAEGKWSLTYSEEIADTIPEDKLAEFAKAFAQAFGVQPQVEDHKITLRLEGTRAALAAALACEFLAVTDFGQLTLGELLMMAGMGAAKLDKSKEEITKLVSSKAADMQGKQEEQNPS
jgi:hypothetical protein